MRDAEVGRLLIASLHQGIADLLPARLEFYEAWLGPAALRGGRVGVAPMTAALSFLRREGEPYRLVSVRAGEYTALWTVEGLAPMQRRLISAAPAGIRARLALGVARDLVGRTYSGSRAAVRLRQGAGAMDIRGSIFCGVRDRSDRPLCDFYASAVGRLMQLFELGAEVGMEQCRATGGEQCVVSVLMRPA